MSDIVSACNWSSGISYRFGWQAATTIFWCNLINFKTSQTQNKLWAARLSWSFIGEVSGMAIYSQLSSVISLSASSDTTFTSGIIMKKTHSRILEFKIWHQNHRPVRAEGVILYSSHCSSPHLQEAAKDGEEKKQISAKRAQSCAFTHVKFIYAGKIPAR